MRKAHFKFYRDRKKEWRWRFVARNGAIIADSAEGYKTKRGAEHGARLIGWQAIDAPFVWFE